MTRRQLAELILVGREHARRVRATFVVKPERVRALGLSDYDLARAEIAADEIERLREEKLSRL